MSGEQIEWGSVPDGRPGGRGRKGVWQERLAPFRERPGEWGKLPGVWNGGSVAAIKSGRLSGIDAGEFEAVCRNGRTVDGSIKFDLWVRYVGGGS